MAVKMGVDKGSIWEQAPLLFVGRLGRESGMREGDKELVAVVSLDRLVGGDTVERAPLVAPRVRRGGARGVSVGVKAVPSDEGELCVIAVTHDRVGDGGGA